MQEPSQAIRPVVAKCNTALVGVVPWCVENSESLRAEVMKVNLPPNARLVASDAVSMYSNINLDHAMPIMREWLESYGPAPSEPKLVPVDIAFRDLYYIDS